MNLRVSPAALGDASASVRGGCDEGTVLLARAIVRDLQGGVGEDALAGFGVALPQVVERIRQCGDALTVGLQSSADRYAHADRLPVVVHR